MSRLRELRMHGFKSFAEPTRFVFEPGVTAIIGPNGSGKSNLADAIRWVLGEQSNRSLRTRRADDVIFAGSETRRPIGMAEVSLTFDNHDSWLPIEFSEVTITRRAYRSGDPEYLINGARVRLRDVVDLLAAGRLGANQLVVVGQGTVDAALSLRPEERRQLFEEAAGVKSLQVRRNEASARLGRARDNLTRVSDLLRELRPQVRRLALQAEHQEAHDTLGRRVRGLVLEHHARRERALQAELGEARRRAAAIAADMAAEREAQAAGRRAVEEAEGRYWASERESRQAAAEWEAAREAVIRAEGRHDSLVERDLDLAADIGRAEREVDELSAEVAAAVDGGAAGPRRTVAQEAEDRWRAAADRARVADAELLAAEEALAALRAREAGRLAESGRRAELEVAVQARRAALTIEREAAAAELATADGRADELALARREAATAQAEAEGRLGTAAAKRDSAAEDAARVATTLAELEERSVLLAAQLAALDAAPEAAGSELGPRLRAGGWTALADELGDLPADAEPALAALLGELDEAFLWRSGADPDVGDASGEARLLRPADGTPAGRAEAMEAVGATQTVAELLNRPRAPEILQRTVVAPRIDDLLAGWTRLPDGWAAVTLAGDLADARGVISVRGRAGSAARRSRTARRAELTTRSAALADDRRAADARQAATLSALEAATAEADAAEAAVEAARILRRRADEDAAAAAGAVDRGRDRLERLDAELAALPQPPAAGSAAANVDRELADLEANAVAAGERQREAASARDAAREAWNEAVRSADMQDAAAADRRAAGARLDERRSLLARLTGEHTALENALTEAASALAEARDREAAAEEGRAAAEQQREAARVELLEAERRLGGGSGRLAELDAAQQQVVAETSRLEEALAGVERERELALEGLPERPEGTEPVEAADSAVDVDLAALDAEALAEDLRRARRTLQQIGSVNPFAIEEHRELSGRLEELGSQESDLRAAVESTESLIGRLDAEISQQFQAAFAAIGEKFDAYCQLLFAGGSASLELTDDAESEAPGGIEIAVRPPGKRLQRLAMLSGGERALAGVALLFAMLSVNPVPFCVLDEVDAALDEANIGRFADALRRLAETIDFVVITHNRATIETADTIYGVTMTDAAVSRVLSLRLADVPVEVTV